MPRHFPLNDGSRQFALDGGSVASFATVSGLWHEVKPRVGIPWSSGRWGDSAPQMCKPHVPLFQANQKIVSLNEVGE